MKNNLLVLATMIMTGFTACLGQSWQSVELVRQITHPQPMTGLVLWPDEARDRHDTYGETIAQCQFIEISDSREYASDFDSTEEPREGSIINII